MLVPFTLLFALLGNGASAFKVILYNGVQCNDNDGTVMDSLAHDKCYTTLSGVAASAIVIKEKGDGSNDAVAFWSGQCQSSNIVAEGNEGCLTFDNYGSFNVISGDEHEGPGRRDLESIARSQHESISASNPLDTFLSSDDPAWLEQILEDERTNPNSITHAKEEFYQGQQVKWWQRAMGVYTAVPIEEWDPSVHKQDSTHHVFGERFPYNYDDVQLATEDSRERNLIREAATFKGICQSFKSCTYAAAGATAGYLNKATPYAVNAYSAVSHKGQELWNWIHDNPGTIVKYVANQGVAAGVGIAGIYIAAAWMGTPQQQALQSCSTSGTTAATIVATVQHTVTTTETVTSIMTVLDTPSTFTEHHHHYHSTKTEWHMAAQATKGDCKTCYDGNCGAPTTKRKRFARGLISSASFRAKRDADGVLAL